MRYRLELQNILPGSLMIITVGLILLLALRGAGVVLNSLRSAEWRRDLQKVLDNHFPHGVATQIPPARVERLRTTGELSSDYSQQIPDERPLWRLLPRAYEGTPIARWRLRMDEQLSLDMYRVSLSPQTSPEESPYTEIVIGVDEAGQIRLIQVELNERQESECGVGEVPFVHEFYRGYKRYEGYLLPSKAVLDVFVPEGERKSVRIYSEEFLLRWDVR